MARFKFPLVAVLRHRKHIEQEKQRDLAKLHAEMQQQQAAFDQLSGSAQGTVVDLRKNRLIGQLDLSYLAAHRRYMLSVQRQLTTMAQRMSLVQRQIDDAQQALAEAAKDRRILEKLHDHQKERWAADVSSRELAEQDEVTTRMAAWSMMGINGESTEPRA